VPVDFRGVARGALLTMRVWSAVPLGIFPVIHGGFDSARGDKKESEVDEAGVEVVRRRRFTEEGKMRSGVLGGSFRMMRGERERAGGLGLRDTTQREGGGGHAGNSEAAEKGALGGDRTWAWQRRGPVGTWHTQPCRGGRKQWRGEVSTGGPSPRHS
jgi:hypothetical protein